MKRMKKFLSLFLCFCMCISLLPTTAAAAEYSVKPFYAKVWQDSDRTGASIHSFAADDTLYLNSPAWVDSSTYAEVNTWLAGEKSAALLSAHKAVTAENASSADFFFEVTCSVSEGTLEIANFQMKDWQGSFPENGAYYLLIWDDAQQIIYYSTETFTIGGSTGSFTITYDANAVNGTNVPPRQTKTAGAAAVISTVTPVRPGNVFMGWNTAADGSGTTFAPGSSYSADADLKLYAQWKLEEYTVAYDANGGSGAPENQIKYYDENLTLSSVVPTRPGYEFTGWNTEQNGSGFSYAPSGLFGYNYPLTLYAQWAETAGPEISDYFIPSGAVDSAFSFTFQATPRNGGGITWSVSSGDLPAGLTLSEAGVLSGTPTAAGTYAFTVRALESGAGATEKSFTLTIDEKLAIGSTTVYFSETSDAAGNRIIVSESEYSCFVYLNRSAQENDAVTATLNYRDAAGTAQTAVSSMEISGSYAYCTGKIPADAVSVTSFVFESGSAREEYPVGKSVACKLNISFSNSTKPFDNFTYISIFDSTGNPVFGTSVFDIGTTINIINLPAGSYTIKASCDAPGHENESGLVDGSGAVIASHPVSLSSASTDLSLTLRDTRYKRITVTATAGGSATYECNYKWYDSSDNLVSEASRYPVMAGDSYKVIAYPTNGKSIFYTESAPVTVTYESAGTVNPALTPKPAAAVSGTVQYANEDGSGMSPLKWTNIYASIPGAGGYSRTVSAFTNETGGFSFSSALPVGTVITASKSGAYDVASYTVTAADCAAGAVTKNLSIALAKGVIYVSATNIVESTKYTYTRYESFGPADFLRISKANGTPLAYRTDGRSCIVLEDPSQVSPGETVFISGGSTPKDGYQEWYLERQAVTLTGDALYGSAYLTATRKGYVGVNYTQQNTSLYQPFDLLVYSGDTLIYMLKNAVTTASRSGYLWTPFLNAGTYTVACINSSYAASLNSSAYASRSALSALDNSFFVTSGSISVADGTTPRVSLALPETEPETDKINRDNSTVAMTQNYANTVTVDLSCAVKNGFELEDGSAVTITISTNQSQQASGDGYISTRSLSINGKPYDINRFGGSGDSNTNGVIRADGTIVLKLTSAQIAAYGGFPLALSTTVVETNTQSYSAEARVEYTDGSGAQHHVKIGSYSETRGNLTLFAPESTTDGSFAVYGKGPVSSSGKKYNVTIYANGVPAASATTDEKQGYYVANIKLSNLKNYDTLRITANGAYADGSCTYTSAASEVVFHSENAALYKTELLWESHEGDYAKNSMNSITLWEDGSPVSLYKAWYRGGNANDEGGVQWRITFENADRVTAVSVLVPRNGTVVEVPANRVSGTNYFMTALKYFPGAAPDGVTISFDANDAEAGSDCEILTQETAEQGYSLLNRSRFISDMQGSLDVGGTLSFNLYNLEDKPIAVTMTTDAPAWDEELIAKFGALSPVSGTSESIVSYAEGYLEVSDGYYCNDIIYRYVNADSGHTLYRRETYTTFSRTVTTYDATSKEAVRTVIALGSGKSQPKGDYSMYGEDLANQYRTGEVQNVWSLFYGMLGEAANEAGTMPDTAPRMSRMKIGLGDLEKAIDYADDSFKWQNGAEITKDEIRKIKDFIDDNINCFRMLYKMHDSASTNPKDNPYWVFSDINATYYQIGIGELGKIVENAFGTGDAFAKGGLKSAGKQVLDTIKDGAKNSTTDWVSGKCFYRQSQNLAYELYRAAKRAQDTETGTGGLCDKIVWDRFPLDLFGGDDLNRDKFVETHNHNHTMPASPQGRYDPSGYIYEAVPSNKIEGATVTLFHLDGASEMKDASGNVTSISGGTLVQTDSAYFGIEENPQITGADGRYQWFVPMGYWRVTASKAGYSAVNTGSSESYGTNAVQNTDDSSWYMPVLPVQLDVNISLVSYDVPEVLSGNVEVTPSGVIIPFSKYMNEATLVPENFALFVNGNAAAFTVTKLNSEKNTAGISYTSKVRLAPAAALTVGDTVQIIVTTDVKSYAGISMTERFDNDSYSVAAETVVAAPTASVAAGEVSANTAVKLSSTTADTVIYYTIDGSDPTTASAVYSTPIYITENVTIKAIAVRYGTSVSDILTAAYTVQNNSSGPAAPTVSKPVATVNGVVVTDGATVPAGRLVITTATPGAEIYYTTNGICPMVDTVNRIQYTGPINLIPGSYYFRIRAYKDGTYSDGLPIHITVVAASSDDSDSGATRYSVNVADTPNGKVSAEMGSASYGTKVVVTATPDAGYKLDTLSIIDAKGNELKLTKLSDTRYEFTMPRDRVTIHAVFAPVKQTVNPFADVASNAYYHDAVLWAVEKGITLGVDATHFNPNGITTRAQVVTFLWRAAGCPEPKHIAGFSDTAANSFYEKAVAWAVENGITNGTSATTFEPNAQCTRGQIVTFLYRFSNVGAMDITDNPFADVEANAFYTDAVLWAAKEGITSGTTATTFSPTAHCLRGQVVTFLYRLLG